MSRAAMFRHTTKQKVRSQDHLKKSATNALEKGRQLLCDTVYKNTYDISLPPSSIKMLNNIVVPLTGCNSEVQGDTRLIYTVATFNHTEDFRLRLCFIQPEVSSSTASVSSAYSEVLNRARLEIISELNNPSPGRVTVSKEKCQITGRISPYAVERSGLGATAEWSYFNASKSRFFYVLSSNKGVELMSMSKETISIYQGFCVKDCIMVYASNMRCFKVTASPEEADTDERPNKSTCMFLYCDGTFKILGTPHKSYKVCALFRDTVLRAHSSSMCSKVVASLSPLEEPGSQPKS
jgi:hypothetical protein